MRGGEVRFFRRKAVPPMEWSDEVLLRVFRLLRAAQGNRLDASWVHARVTAILGEEFQESKKRESMWKVIDHVARNPSITEEDMVRLLGEIRAEKGKR
jgi:hypothetical protein